MSRSFPEGDRVAAAALCRAVLLGRCAATLTASGAGLLLAGDRAWLAAVLLVVAVTSAVEIAALTRWPSLVCAPWVVVAGDCVALLGVLLISRGSVAYFCYAMGSAALAGVLLGMRAVVLWAAQAALGFAVAAAVLRDGPAPTRLVGFVVVFPMAGVLAGVAAAAATAALVRYVELSFEVIAQAQRSAAASERARLARELHDSVAKTLRGISFAALAIPSSLRRHPALAEQLASTVSEGATVAARETRELLQGMRLDAPDRAFCDTVREMCEAWSVSTAIPVATVAAPVEPAVDVRYELSRILHEALQNVARHAQATRVSVSLRSTRRMLELRVTDDGIGFALPEDLADLHADGHFGLVGMRERAATICGRLHVVSAPGGGTSITVTVPR